jgi:ribonuclease HI
LGSLSVNVFTDGSCSADHETGVWACILFIENEKIVLKGSEANTTHNRMELLAVMNAIEFLDQNYKDASIHIFTDSQYVQRIPERKEKLTHKNFLTNHGTPIQNADLVKKLILQIETHSVHFIKVKAHQKQNSTPNFNREVDQIARESMRNITKQHTC